MQGLTGAGHEMFSANAMAVDWVLERDQNIFISGADHAGFL